MSVYVYVGKLVLPTRQIRPNRPIIHTQTLDQLNDEPNVKLRSFVSCREFKEYSLFVCVCLCFFFISQKIGLESHWIASSGTFFRFLSFSTEFRIASWQPFFLSIDSILLIESVK